MIISKYYSPKFYLDSATRQLHIFKQFFSVKILLFCLSLVSVSAGYARPVNSMSIEKTKAAVSTSIKAGIAKVKESMSDFSDAESRTAIFEAGYQNDANDNGNWTGGRRGKGSLVGTNYGITASLLASYLGHKPSAADMKNLSPETAKEIYKKLYWSEIKGDEIKNQETANQIYDCAVNMGTGTAIMLSQRSLGLPETKIMDEATLAALNQN
ncbi:MAG: hypothetical protein JWN76_3522 [Chitinophagaceae bacterium]|nr:hypothetical protein [Chitinophagaceae bacterium]